MATLSNVIGGHGVADGVILLVVQTWRKREKERERVARQAIMVM